jgi:Fe2+ or Zn2+ uptake regulation protein
MRKHDFKDDQKLINVLLLYGIQPTALRVQVLRAVLELQGSDFTGEQLLTRIQTKYIHFQYHTLFASLIVFSRKGLLEKRPQRNSRVGRPMQVFTIPVVVLKLFGTTDQEL